MILRLPLIEVNQVVEISDTTSNKNAGLRFAKLLYLKFKVFLLVWQLSYVPFCIQSGTGQVKRLSRRYFVVIDNSENYLKDKTIQSKSIFEYCKPERTDPGLRQHTGYKKVKYRFLQKLYFVLKKGPDHATYFVQICYKV